MNNRDEINMKNTENKNHLLKIAFRLADLYMRMCFCLERNWRPSTWLFLVNTKRHKPAVFTMMSFLIYYSHLHFLSRKTMWSLKRGNQKHVFFFFFFAIKGILLKPGQSPNMLQRKGQKDTAQRSPKRKSLDPSPINNEPNIFDKRFAQP